ncbi:hypothetical protein SUDANB126_00887 [Streptomyces sp. enrichment culture]
MNRGCRKDTRRRGDAGDRGTGGRRGTPVPDVRRRPDEPHHGHRQRSGLLAASTQWIRVCFSNTGCSPHLCRNDAETARPVGVDGPAPTVGRGNVAAGEPHQWSLTVHTPDTRSCGTGSADTGATHARPHGETGRQICG